MNLPVRRTSSPSHGATRRTGSPSYKLRMVSSILPLALEPDANTFRLITRTRKSNLDGALTQVLDGASVAEAMTQPLIIRNVLLRVVYTQMIQNGGRQVGW